MINLIISKIKELHLRIYNSKLDIQFNQNNLLNIIEKDFGHKKSYIKKEARLKDSMPVPWFTYPAIEFLESLDLSELDIFEFGSGVGTLYWAKKAKSVISVESDSDWYSKVLNMKGFKIKKYLLEKSKANYTGSILKQKKMFDIIIVDGVYRYECTINAMKCLKKGGIIIFDNAEWYKKTTDMLRRYDFKQIDFCGFGPVVYFTWKTSLFIKSLESLKYNSKNYIPIGSYKHNVEPE